MTDSVTHHADEAIPADEATQKGVVEDDGRDRKQVGSLAGQLGHRDPDEMLKDNDTDFP